MFTRRTHDGEYNLARIKIGRTLMQMFQRELTHRGHTTKFSVAEGGQGWEVRVEEDSRVVHRACYTDWHRVEWAVSKFTLDAAALEREGWSEKTELIPSISGGHPAGHSTKR